MEKVRRIVQVVPRWTRAESRRRRPWPIRQGIASYQVIRTLSKTFPAWGWKTSWMTPRWIADGMGVEQGKASGCWYEPRRQRVTRTACHRVSGSGTAAPNIVFFKNASCRFALVPGSRISPLSMMPAMGPFQMPRQERGGTGSQVESRFRVKPNGLPGIDEMEGVKFGGPCITTHPPPSTPNHVDAGEGLHTSVRIASSLIGTAPQVRSTEWITTGRASLPPGRAVLPALCSSIISGNLTGRKSHTPPDEIAAAGRTGLSRQAHRRRNTRFLGIFQPRVKGTGGTLIVSSWIAGGIVRALDLFRFSNIVLVNRCRLSSIS